MKILAIDSSSKTASVAITEAGNLIYESFINAGLTHSQTLMKMVEDSFKNAAVKPEEIDCFALTAGPGSFTGLRIGTAAVKGMANALNKPCVPVSTLLTLAYNMSGFKGRVLSLLDARRGQFYFALFDIDNQKVERITEDSAEDGEKIREILLKNSSDLLYLVGDGAKLWYNNYLSDYKGLKIQPVTERAQYVNAYSVALCALDRLPGGGAVTAEELSLEYLRLPQAEREFNAKQDSRG